MFPAATNTNFQSKRGYENFCIYNPINWTTTLLLLSIPACCFASMQHLQLPLNVRNRSVSFYLHKSIPATYIIPSPPRVSQSKMINLPTPPKIQQQTLIPLSLSTRWRVLSLSIWQPLVTISWDDHKSLSAAFSSRFAFSTALFDLPCFILVLLLFYCLLRKTSNISIQRV
jgi:hypothetical protein